MARTKAQMKKLHRELWQWLADNPENGKGDWPKWNRIARPLPLHECFACEAAGFDFGMANCDKCPCVWSSKKDDNYCSLSSESPYIAWELAREKDRTKYALLVRDAWVK